MLDPIESVYAKKPVVLNAKVVALGGVRVMPASFQMPTLRSRDSDEATAPIINEICTDQSATGSLELGQNSRSETSSVKEYKTKVTGENLDTFKSILVSSNERRHLCSDDSETSSNQFPINDVTLEGRSTILNAQPDDPKRCSSAEIDISEELGELTESERDFKMDYERCKAERLAEQTRATSERQRLDDIITMCSELERQLDTDTRRPGPQDGLGGGLNVNMQCKLEPVNQRITQGVARTFKLETEGGSRRQTGDRQIGTADRQLDRRCEIIVDARSSCPGGGKIKTNGSLTSPVHGRRSRGADHVDQTEYSNLTGHSNTAGHSHSTGHSNLTVHSYSTGQTRSSIGEYKLTGGPPASGGHTFNSLRQYKLSGHSVQPTVGDNRAGLNPYDVVSGRETQQRSRSLFNELSTAAPGCHDYDDVYTATLSDSSDCLSDDGLSSRSGVTLDTSPSIVDSNSLTPGSCDESGFFSGSPLRGLNGATESFRGEPRSPGGQSSSSKQDKTPGGSRRLHSAPGVSFMFISVACCCNPKNVLSF